MEPEVVIFVGLQATGKSTFFTQQYSATHVRINLDMLTTRHREARLFDVCLSTSQSCVIDNTNATREFRSRYLSMAKSHGFRTKCFYFESKIKDAIGRNQLREPPFRVPEKGILATYASLEIPCRDEGFDELNYVTIENQTFVIQEWKDEV